MIKIEKVSVYGLEEAIRGMRNPMKHKLDEWREFCRWIEKLPYSEVIIGEKEEPNE